MTFQQYLENIRTWTTKDPKISQGDINVTADYSEDENDASHFLLPFMRKVKAFYWYVRVACNELAEHITVPDPRELHHGHPLPPMIRRSYSLHRMLGSPTQGSAHLDDLNNLLQRVMAVLRDFYEEIEIHLEGNSSYDQLRRFLKSRVMPAITRFLDESVRLPVEEEHLHAVVQRIKDSVRRMARFFEASKDQLSRVSDFNFTKRNYVDLRGRR